MKKIYYQVVEKVLPQVYLLYNSFNNKFILLNNVRYEKYKKENILELEQSDPVLYKSLVDNQYIVPDDFDELLKLPGVGRKSANLIMGDVSEKKDAI